MAGGKVNVNDFDFRQYSLLLRSLFGVLQDTFRLESPTSFFQGPSLYPINHQQIPMAILERGAMSPGQNGRMTCL